MVNIENTTIRLEIDNRLDRAIQSPSNLKPGNVVSARIVRLISENRIELDFGGRFQAEAHFNGAVNPGQILQLKVLSTGPPLHLQLIPSEKSGYHDVLPQMNMSDQISHIGQERFATMLTKIIDLFGHSQTTFTPDRLNQAVMYLKQILQPISLNASSEALAGRLTDLIENTGLFWEKKVFDALVQIKNTPTIDNPQLASSQNGGFESASAIMDKAFPAISGQDLKSQQFILRSFFQSLGESIGGVENNPASQAEFLSNVIGRLFEHIEQQQNHIIQRHSVTENYQIISHWIPLEGQDQQLKLKLYYPKKKGADDSLLPQQVCLLLDLDALGPLRIDLTMMDRRLQIVFSVVDQHLLEFVEMRTSSMINTLEGLFLDISSTVRVAPEKIETFETEDTDEVEKGRVDIRA